MQTLKNLRDRELPKKKKEKGHDDPLIMEIARVGADCPYGRAGNRWYHENLSEQG
jgi:hypothetical protein